MVDVVQFQRRAGPTSFSVERLFADVRAAMPADIRIKLRINDYMSRGLADRLRDALAAWRVRGPVNHVLGDVHYLAWLLPRPRTVLTVLDCVSLDRLTGLRRWLFWLLWYWWPMRKAAHVTVISRFSEAALRKWINYPAERIHVIHPPVSSEFQPSPLPPRGARIRLLQVGTVANKNVPRVIEAVAGLPVVLVLVGHVESSLVDRMRALGIAFEQHEELDRDALVDQYRQADIVVFASTYEGFGLPIIEAQSIGRPVVTSDVGAMPEAAGGAACLVDPLDVQDIRRGIRRLIEDEGYAAQLVRLGLENAASYSPRSIAEQYAALYRRVDAEASAAHVSRAVPAAGKGA